MPSLPPPRFVHLALCAAFSSLLLASCQEKSASRAAPPVARGPISYNFEIRPLLARKCVPCHGPDQKKNKSGLRLDSGRFAFHPLGDDEQTDLHAFFPGDRDNSVAWQRIHSDEPEEHMPPPGEGEALTSQERDLLGRWIDEGANFEPHWAFQPLPRVVETPEVSSPSPFLANKIDRFVLARLERAGWDPSPPADPPALLRRLSLALTGLPPTIDQIHDFEHLLASGEGKAWAYRQTVERLLASSAFGEHFAALWLKTARYADDFGPDDRDLTSRWVYRDWVIEAFNDNLSYDQFLTAQLAGDLDDSGQLLPTAFNRLHPLTSNLAADGEKERRRHAAARVQNLGSTILGLSLHCARCHDHVADPLSQSDFQSLAGFFNSISESGLAPAGGIAPAPTLALPTAEQSETLLHLQATADDAEKTSLAARTAEEESFSAWLHGPLLEPIIEDAVGIFSFDDRQARIPNRSLAGDQAGDAGELEFTKGFSGAAVRFQGSGGVSFPDLFPARRWIPWSLTLRLRDTEGSLEPVVLLSRGRGSLAGLRGLDLLLEDGHLVARLAREWPGNAIAIRTVDRVVPRLRWSFVTWTYDGSSSAAGMKLFVEGVEVPTEVIADSLWNLPFPEDDEPLPLQLGWRDGAPGFSGGAIDDFQVHARALTPLEIRHLYDGRALTTALGTPEQHLVALREFFFSSLHPATRRLHQELTSARQACILPEEGILEVSIMREWPAATPVDPRHPPALPAFLPQPQSASPANPGHSPREKSPGGPPNRLNLAASLTTLDHPLTARVFVNRIWAHFFGRGLVDPPEEFGFQGATPSHPQLLDWLARDFVSHNWDVKHLCKQIVLSASFHQDSAPRPDLVDRDPQNRLLARGPSFELSPAQTRDLILQATGVLDHAVGGPPESASRHPSRRSLYTPHRHPAPPPDPQPEAQPDSQSKLCSIDYSHPDPIPSPPELTPEHHLAASSFLAERLLLDFDLDLNRFEDLTLRFLGRAPTADESAQLSGFLADQMDRFSSASSDPSPEPPPPPNPDLDPRHHRAWTALVQAAPFLLEANRQR